MKSLLFTASLFISLSVTAQSGYVLLERGWYRPAKFTDTLAREDIKAGYFPIHADQLDSLIAFVGTFQEIRKHGLKRKYFDNEDFKTGSIRFEISNIKHAYGDIYDITILSNVAGGEYRFKLSDPQNDSEQNVRLIKGFYSYLKETAKRRK